MSMCPNSKAACECQPQDGVMCQHGPTPDDWPSDRPVTREEDKWLHDAARRSAKIVGGGRIACSFCKGTGTAFLTGPGGGYGTCPDCNGTGKARASS